METENISILKTHWLHIQFDFMLIKVPICLGFEENVEIYLFLFFLEKGSLFLICHNIEVHFYTILMVVIREKL